MYVFLVLYPALVWDLADPYRNEMIGWTFPLYISVIVGGCIPGPRFPATRFTYYLPTKESLTIISMPYRADCKIAPGVVACKDLGWQAPIISRTPVSVTGKT